MIDYRIHALVQINAIRETANTLFTHFCDAERVVGNEHGVYYARQHIKRIREILAELDACIDAMDKENPSLREKAHE